MISYLQETLYILSFWEVRLIQFFVQISDFQIESWLLEDGVSGYLELLYHGSWYRLEASYFHAKCYNRGATIAVI